MDRNIWIKAGQSSMIRMGYELNIIAFEQLYLLQSIWTLHLEPSSGVSSNCLSVKQRINLTPFTVYFDWNSYTFNSFNKLNFQIVLIWKDKNNCAFQCNASQFGEHIIYYRNAAFTWDVLTASPLRRESPRSYTTLQRLCVDCVWVYVWS